MEVLERAAIDVEILNVETYGMCLTKAAQWEVLERAAHHVNQINDRWMGRIQRVPIHGQVQGCSYA